jgi:prepilin-type N-terminal cleavage/methylation domain-containing protein
MKTARFKNGFTILEILMSLVILAVLMTAVAVAFDASIVNFQANEGISKTTNAARVALLRMTTELRSAKGVDVVNNAQYSIVTFDNRDVTYSIGADVDKPGKSALYLQDNSVVGKPKHVMCRNVVPGNSSFVAGGPASAVKNVRIVLTLTDDEGKNPQTLAAAAVVRRNLN